MSTATDPSAPSSDPAGADASVSPELATGWAMSREGREIEIELAAFVAWETRLVDEARYDEWIALFTDDGHYWVPSGTDQRSPGGEASLAYEDKLLLRLRAQRLAHPHAHSQHPASRAIHVLQPSRLVGVEAEAWILRTPFVYAEARGEQELSLAGVAWHHLVGPLASPRIRLKRVDLLSAGAALPMIQLFP
ncbi:MAG: aromatic-ring-hydroxylating dioxygenase subunit beta [Burkholderiaceae bacterium]